tara:strand:- start:797 stop:904 length:108 start_codon:yes stop_codon:yes gene_type:complete
MGWHIIQVDFDDEEIENSAVGDEEIENAVPSVGDL